jgi:plastocyanin
MAFGRGSAFSLVLALMVARTPLAAQGAVSGQVSVLEKPGETGADLSNTVIYLELPAGVKFKAKPSHAVITMHAREFVPHVTIVTVGSTVQFVNQDPFQHNAFSNTASGTFDFGLSDRGTTVEQVLRRAGIFPVFCNIHARMSAFVLVLGTPYFTQAGSDGRFSLATVPAGAYMLHVWNEKGGEFTRALAVTAAGANDVSVQLDARGFQRVAHKNKFGQDYTSAGGDRY